MTYEKETKMIDDEQSVATRELSTSKSQEDLIGEMIDKEAKVKLLDDQKRAYLKEINHIKRSNTWKYSTKFRYVHNFLHKILGRQKKHEQSQYIQELETKLWETKKELYETREQLNNIRLDDRMLNSYQIIDFIKNKNDEGELADFLDQVIRDKQLHDANYNAALRYAARLFMNKKTEYKHFIYSNILTALKIEDIPEFMLREGLVEEDSISLNQVSSFRASLSMRLRQKQLRDRLPEFQLEDKIDAYHFIDYLNIRRPRIIDHKFSIGNVPKKDHVVIKPIDGAGSRGVYLVYHFDDIIDVNRSRQITSWEDLKTSMKEDLQSGRVEKDLWLMEELILEDNEEKIPASDIKFYCFYGKVGVILEICRYPERKHCWWTATGERIRTGKYEEELFLGKGVSQDEIQMASELSLKVPAPFIRIDFLRSQDDLVFGEFTAKPGNYDEFDVETDQWLGDLYLEGQGRLYDDLLNGNPFEEYKKFRETLGYSDEDSEMINM